MRFVGYVSAFLDTQEVALANMVPSDDLVTSGWCLARAGDELIVRGQKSVLPGAPVDARSRGACCSEL